MSHVQLPTTMPDDADLLAFIAEKNIRMTLAFGGPFAEYHYEGTREDLTEMIRCFWGNTGDVENIVDREEKQPMTVNELVALLQRFDGNLPVTVMSVNGPEEYPLGGLGNAVVTLEGGGASPQFVALNVAV